MLKSRDRVSRHTSSMFKVVKHKHLS